VNKIFWRNLFVAPAESYDLTLLKDSEANHGGGEREQVKIPGKKEKGWMP